MKSIKNQTPPANGQNRKKGKFESPIFFAWKKTPPTNDKRRDPFSRSRVWSAKRKKNQTKKELCDSPFSSHLIIIKCARAPTRIYCKSVYIKIPR